MRLKLASRVMATKKKFGLINSLKMPRSNDRFWQEVAAGKQIQVHGKYYMAKHAWDRLPTWKKEEVHAIAVGWASRSGVLIGRSAAILWEFPTLSLPRGARPVTWLGYANGHKPGGNQQQASDIRVSAGFIPARHVEELGDLRVTSKARTLIDCARFEDFENALVIAEGALRKHPHLQADINLALKEMKGSPGLPKARQRLALANTKSESAAESRAKAQFITAGLYRKHTVKQNPELLVDHMIFRPDFLIDDWLVVEIDGEEKYFGKYSAPDEALRAERQREVKLQNAGYRVMRFGWNDLEQGDVAQRVGEVLQPLVVPTPA